MGERSGQSAAGTVTIFSTVGPVPSLYGLDALAADARTTPTRSGLTGVTIAINLATVAEVGVAYDEWLAAGGSSLAAPATAPWGGHIAYVADLDGHVWELAHNPSWPLNDHGSLTCPTECGFA